MNVYTKPRPIPARPLISAIHLRDARIAAANDARVDLSEFKGSKIAMTIEGVIELTNIDPRNAQGMIEHGLVGPKDGVIADTIEFDPAHTRADIYKAWAARTPKPLELQDFDHIITVRDLLHLPADTPHPRHFVEGAFEFLNEHGCGNSREVGRLLQTTMRGDAPTGAMFAEISGSTKRKAATKGTLKELRSKLPLPILDVEEIALSGRAEDESAFAVPSPQVLGILTELGPLRTPATVHVFRLAARVVNEVYISRVVIGLRDLEERIVARQNAEGLSLEEAAEIVLRDLMASSTEDSREGRKAGAMLNAWSGMIDDLQVPSEKLVETDAHLLTWPRTICPAEFAANRTHRYRAEKIARGKRRLLTSSGLADELPAIIRGVDCRYRELENLRALANAARDDLAKSTARTSVPIVQQIAELDGKGLPTGKIAVHRYRLWNTEALFKSLLEFQERPLRKESLFARVSRNRFPKTITASILIYEGSTGSRPWYEHLFRAFLFNPERTLPPEIRQSRYELIRDMQLPANNNRSRGILTFHKSDAAAARVLIGEGHLAIPIEEFATAMQIAHTAFSLALVTAARVGEITQIRIDGSNVGYDKDFGLAYWSAQPKQQNDRMEPEPFVRKYYIDEQTLACMVSLKHTMTGFLGRAGAALSVRPSNNLKKLGHGSWLFRNTQGMLDPATMKNFLQYLSAGIGSFGIHDVRAAVAKYRYDHGDSIDEIRNLLGHAGTGMTRGYARPTEKMLARKRKDRRMLTDVQRRLARLDQIRRRMA